MSAIRHGEEGFSAYIYFDSNRRLSISAPSVTLTTTDMAVAKAVLAILVLKKEVPENIWERVMKECWEFTVTKND